VKSVGWGQVLIIITHLNKINLKYVKLRSFILIVFVCMV